MSEAEKEALSLATLLGQIRANKPLIHHITNMVVMNDTANITLAVGALPVMAHAIEEVEEMGEEALQACAEGPLRLDGPGTQWSYAHIGIG